MSKPPIELVGNRFQVSRGWTWHGGVDLASMLAGHWSDEPCDVCRANDAAAEADTYENVVTAIDRDSGTITFDHRLKKR